MKSWFFGFVLIAWSSGMARADDRSDRSAKVVNSPSDSSKSTSSNSSPTRVEAYLHGGTAGVYFRENEDTHDGKIIRIYVVGTATVNTALGVSEGLEWARERAGEVARSEFVNWLGSKVTIRKTVEGEMQLVKDGNENHSGQGESQEAMKKTERRTTIYEETASSLVRGLKFIAGEDRPHEKRYVAVYRWDFANVNGIRELKEQLNREHTGTEMKSSDRGMQSSKTSPNKKELPGKKVIFDE